MKKEKSDLELLKLTIESREFKIKTLIEENDYWRGEAKKLKEFKTKREESMFYFKAQMERAEPKTAREAEDLQRAKEIFEKLYREELSCLEEENRNLKSDLAFERTMLDNVRAEYESLQNVIKKLKEEVRFLEECLDRKEKLNEKYRKEIEELKETLEHRDSVLSIMYDLLRSDLGDYEQLCMIDVVIDVEVGNEPQNKLREELLDRFWKRDF